MSKHQTTSWPPESRNIRFHTKDRAKVAAITESQFHHYYYGSFLTGDSSTISIISFREKKKVPFSMAIENGELVHECFLKHSRIRTARMK